MNRNGVRAYAFNSDERAVAIAWRGDGPVRPLKLAAGLRAYDVMGNELSRGEIRLGESPLYVVARRDESKLLLDAIGPQ